MNNRNKIALIVEYDGSQFHGWQRQSDLRTVQLCLEEAISCVADSPITTICAGRTDAGVHAYQQVVHFETDVERPETAWIFGSNAYLPPDIRVHFAKKMPPDFHARFSATARRYQYVILNQPVRSAINRHRVSWEVRPLNCSLMNEAARYFIGEQDFSSFRAAQCQSNSPFRRIDHLNITQQNHHIFIDIKANAFLHHMVRNIAGVIMTIGAGERPPEWAKAVILAKNRQAAGITAPASGLYLVDVEYPDHFGVPKKAISCVLG